MAELPAVFPRYVFVPSCAHLGNDLSVNTNDAFLGIDSEDLVMKGSSKAFPPAFDAGEKVSMKDIMYYPPAVSLEGLRQRK